MLVERHIKKFIAESGSELAYDPFAGTGCMLDAVSQEISNIQTIKGLDIDESLGWKKNDSLLSISKEKDAIIITNPPYLTKYSASRKKIGNDSTDPNDRIRFAFKDEIDYNWDAKIKVSSRLLTLIKIDIPEGKQKLFIDECNRILNNLRERSHDIIFSPFKGNTKNGIRRRRLDFQTCRAISEQVYLHGNGACFWRSRKFY